MTYEEALKKSEELKAHLNGAFSVEQRSEIERLYKAVLLRDMKRTSCQRCYHDALIEVVLYLRKEGKMREKTDYALRAGFIIHCTSFHNGKIYTNMNLTDEVAREYLAIFPNKRNMFARIPEETAYVRSTGIKDTESITTSATDRKAVKRKKTKK